MFSTLVVNKDVYINSLYNTLYIIAKSEKLSRIIVHHRYTLLICLHFLHNADYAALLIRFAAYTRGAINFCVIFYIA